MLVRCLTARSLRACRGYFREILSLSFCIHDAIEDLNISEGCDNGYTHSQKAALEPEGVDSYRLHAGQALDRRKGRLRPQASHIEAHSLSCVHHCPAICRA